MLLKWPEIQKKKYTSGQLTRNKDQICADSPWLEKQIFLVSCKTPFGYPALTVEGRVLRWSKWIPV